MRRIPELDVIIVSWKHDAALGACLQSLSESARPNYRLCRVIVVDNLSAPPLVPALYAGLPEVTVIANRRNRGFATGCNQGAYQSRADYLLFLNPDTCVGPNSLATALAHFERDTERRTAIVGLQIVNSRHEPEPTCGRFPDVRRVFAQVTGLKLLAPARFDGIRMTDWDHRETRAVDYVSGACLFVRRAVFEQVGGFDDRLFLYLEDADLALRARRLGWQATFVAADPVMHHDGWSTGHDRAWRLAQSWRSLIAYSRKHLHPGSAAAVVAIVLTLGPLARLAQAAWRRSGQELAAAVVGYAWLWRLMVGDVITFIKLQHANGFGRCRPHEARRQPMTEQPREVAFNTSRDSATP